MTITRKVNMRVSLDLRLNDVEVETSVSEDVLRKVLTQELLAHSDVDEEDEKTLILNEKNINAFLDALRRLNVDSYNDLFENVLTEDDINYYLDDNYNDDFNDDVIDSLGWSDVEDLTYKAIRNGDYEIEDIGDYYVED